MLILRRRSGQWTEFTHVKSGDLIRVRTVRGKGDGREDQIDLWCDDAPRNFLVQRPERILRRSQSERPPIDRV